MGRRHACWLLGPFSTCLALCWADETVPLGRTVHRFKVPEQDAARSLLQIAGQLGVAVLAAPEDLRGVRTHAVAGSLSVDEALTRLLAGTGLTFSYTPDGRSVLWRRSGAAAPRAAAAPDAAAPAHSAEGAQLPDVMVTAQRRPADLQTVPVSVVVLSGNLLDIDAVDSYHTVSQLIPSFVDGQNSRGGNRFIRGIGSGESQTFEQSVGVYLDDIYHGRTRTDEAELLDLDRIEILRGPQTTLFGANAIAGALNLTSRRPGDTHESSARLLYGTHGQYLFEAVESGPVSRTLAVRLAVLAGGTQGWLHDETTGRDVPGQNNLTGRATLVWRPDDALEATFKIEGGRDRNIGALALQDAGCPPPSGFTLEGFCKVALAAGVPLGLSAGAIAQSAGQQLLLSTGETVLTVHADLGGSLLTSVSGAYRYSYDSHIDTDGTPQQLLNIAAPEHYTQVSQELRLASPPEQVLSYQAGLYFHSGRLFYLHDTAYFFLTPQLSATPALAPLVPALPLGQTLAFNQPERTCSVFGALTWAIDPALSWSAGLRASWVEKSYAWLLYYGTATAPYGGIVPLPAALDPAVQAVADAASLGTAGSLSGRREDHGLMPGAQLRRTFPRQVSAYLSVSRGWKAGGFNGNDLTGEAANIPFAPEHVNAYEAGLKSEWLARSLRLNVDAFRSDYTDLQVATNVAGSTGSFESLVRNAASSRTQGLEMEGEWLFAGLRLASTVSYDESRYLTYRGVAPTQLQQAVGILVQDLSGRPTEFAPKWAGTLDGSYTWGLGRVCRLTAGMTGIGATRYYLTGNDDPTVQQGDYLRLDARLTLAGVDGHWAVDLLGRNLTDRDILTFGVNWPTSPGGTFLQKQEPRNGALQLRLSW